MLFEYKSEKKFFLRRHILNVHKPNVNVRFSCSICQKKFMTEHSLHRHRTEVHGNVKNIFKCTHENCLYITRWPRYLERHIRRQHSEVDRYSCTMCTYTNAEKSFLRRHEFDAHNTIDSGFTCAFCPKKFVTVSNLQVHLREFHGDEENVYKCTRENCLYVTLTRLCFERHMRGCSKM